MRWFSWPKRSKPPDRRPESRGNSRDKMLAYSKSLVKRHIKSYIQSFTGTINYEAVRGTTKTHFHFISADHVDFVDLVPDLQWAIFNPVVDHFVSEGFDVYIEAYRDDDPNPKCPKQTIWIDWGENSSGKRIQCKWNEPIQWIEGATHA